jgi:hypothetical protein
VLITLSFLERNIFGTGGASGVPGKPHRTGAGDLFVRSLALLGVGLSPERNAPGGMARAGKPRGRQSTACGEPVIFVIRIRRSAFGVRRSRLRVHAEGVGD